MTAGGCPRHSKPASAAGRAVWLATRREVQLAAILLLTCFVFRPALRHAPRADTLSVLNHLAGLDSLASILRETASLNRRPARFLSDNSRGNPRFAFVSYKPLTWTLMGVEKWLFGYRFGLWECVHVGMHLCIVAVLFRILTYGRPDAHVVPVSLTAWFAVQYAGMEAAVQVVLGGMLLSLLGTLIFLHHLQKGLSVGRVEFAWFAVAALAIAALAYEVGVMAAGLFLLLGLGCNLVHALRGGARRGVAAPFSAGWLLAVAGIIAFYVTADLVDMRWHAAAASPDSRLASYRQSLSCFLLWLGKVQVRWLGSGLLPRWLKLGITGRIEAQKFGPDFQGLWTNAASVSALAAVAAFALLGGLKAAAVLTGRRKGTRGNLLFAAAVAALMLGFATMIVAYRIGPRSPERKRFILNNGIHYAYVYNLLAIVALGRLVGFRVPGGARTARGVAAGLFGAAMVVVVAANAHATLRMNTLMATWSAGRNEMIRRAEYLVRAHRRESGFSFAVKESPVNRPIHWFHRSSPSLCEVLYPHCYDSENPKWVLDCSDVLVEWDSVHPKKTNYRGFNIVAAGGRFYALACGEGGFTIKNMQLGRYRRCYVADSLEQACAAADRARAAGEADGVAAAVGAPPDWTPHLVEENYRGFNIIACAGRFYALAQSEGPFSIQKVRDRAYKHCYGAPTVAQAKSMVDRHVDGETGGRP